MGPVLDNGRQGCDTVSYESTLECSLNIGERSNWFEDDDDDDDDTE